MKILNRRSFLAASAAAGVAAMSTGCKPKAPEAVDPVVDPVEETINWAPTATNPDLLPLFPQEAPKILTDEQIDFVLNNPAQVTEPWVNADGTTVAPAYVMARNVINRNGMGFGSLVIMDHQFDMIQMLFTEEEAALYAQMPFYTMFSAKDLAQKTGKDEAYCLDICNALAEKAMLRRIWENGVPMFNTQGSEYGYYEAYVKHFTKEYLDAKDLNQGVDMAISFCDSGTTMYRTMPVSLDTIIDGKYNEWDDWRGVLKRASKIAISPCMCRSKQIIQSGMASSTQEILEKGIRLDEHPVETCITTGKEAEYFIETGAGREITAEEATKIYEDAVKQGMIVESVFTKASESICLCHANCCLNVGAVRTLNGGPAMKSYSDFDLYHAKDKCIKCGSCIDRCPMFAITKDAEGYPVVDNACVRCGQCALICPQGVRGLKLTADPAPIPDDILEDYRLKAINRIGKGYMFDTTTMADMAATAEAMGDTLNALIAAVAANDAK